MIDKILLTGGVILLFICFLRSFKKRPCSYINILLLSGILFIIPFIITGDPVKRSLILFIPMCILCIFLIVSNVSLIMHEGFRKKSLLGFIFPVLYLMAAAALWFIIYPMSNVPSPLSSFLKLMLYYGECTVLAICMAGYAVVRVKPHYDRDFVIILGCSVSRKGMLRPLIKDRTNKAIHFVWEQEWRKNKTAFYVPSGGQGSDEPISEGSAMALYLLSHGAEDNEVFPEKRSRNTFENLIFSKKIIDDIDPDAKIAVVTNDFHVLRSGMLSYRAGITPDLIGCRTVWYFRPSAFLREMIAILVMNMRFHIAATVILCISSVFIA